VLSELLVKATMVETVLMVLALALVREAAGALLR